VSPSKINPNIVWIGSRTQGLIKYDGNNWEHFSEKNGKFPTDFILSIETDSSGNVYVGTVWEGVGIYNGNNWKFFNDDNLSFQVGSIQKIVYKDGILWAVDSQRIIKYDGNEWFEYLLEDYGLGCLISTFDCDRYGNIWFGDACRNLFQFDGTNFTEHTAFEECVPNGSARYIHCSDDTVYIGTGEGLVIYDRSNFLLYNSENTPLKQNWVNAVLVDESNVKWIATADSGIYKYDNKNWKEFSSYNSGFPYLIAYKIKIDKNGNKWMSTAAGLIIYSGLDWNCYQFDEPGNYNIYGEIYDFDIDRNSDIWAFAVSSIYKYKGDGWEKFDTEDYGLPELIWEKIVAIDKNNVIWIGTDFGLIKFDTTNCIVYDTTNSILPDNDVFSLDVDSKNNKWIVPYDEAIIRFDDSEWTIFNKETTGFNIFKFPMFGPIEDIKGDLWFYKDNGLLIYDGSSWYEKT